MWVCAHALAHINVIVCVTVCMCDCEMYCLELLSRQQLNYSACTRLYWAYITVFVEITAVSINHQSESRLERQLPLFGMALSVSVFRSRGSCVLEIGRAGDQSGHSGRQYGMAEWQLTRRNSSCK